MKKTKDSALGRLPALQRRILLSLKSDGPSTIARLAREHRVTTEAVRLQLTDLARRGWVEKTVARRGVGRPVGTYRLAPAAEPLFPKAYDELAVELLDAAAGTLGPDAVKRMLASMADARVREWLPRLKGMSLDQRLRFLTGVYRPGDPFMRAEGGKEPRLVETNCPFFSVASKRPVLCSLTVSVLSRLLGRRVARAESFQAGDGRCVFRVLAEKVRADAPFETER